MNRNDFELVLSGSWGDPIHRIFHFYLTGVAVSLKKFHYPRSCHIDIVIACLTFLDGQLFRTSLGQLILVLVLDRADSFFGKPHNSLSSKHLQTRSNKYISVPVVLLHARDLQTELWRTNKLPTFGVAKQRFPLVKTVL